MSIVYSVDLTTSTAGGRTSDGRGCSFPAAGRWNAFTARDLSMRPVAGS
jgi:hypothetical protein